MLCSGKEGMGPARWLLLGMLLIGCTVGLGSAVAVTGPVVIDSPGTYELTKDILDTTASVCIEIRCDDVVFDGKGHLIRGVDAPNSAGVLVHGSGQVSNVVVRNIRTEDWYYGIYFWGVCNGRVDGSTARDNYFGLAFNPSSDSAISNSRFSSNSYGMVLTGSTRNQVMGCRLTDNDQAGISVYGSTGNTFANNLLQNEKNVLFVNGGSPSNRWNVERRDGPNIVGGRIIGGNCWLKPDGSGVSASSSQKDGILTEPYKLATNNVDNLPLAAHPEGGVETVTPTITPKADPTDARDGTPSRPFVAVRHLPGTIQAEDYDLGGPGIGYFTPRPVSNTVYRKGNIQIVRNVNESGYHLAGTRYREWLRYTVEVGEAGTHTVSARVASPSSGQHFKVIDECHPGNQVTLWVPATGSYDLFKTTRSLSFHLEPGRHTLKVFSYGTQAMDSFTFT